MKIKKNIYFYQDACVRCVFEKYFCNHDVHLSRLTFLLYYWLLIIIPLTSRENHIITY